VAPQLKYNTHFTDLDALQRELGSSPASARPPAADDVDEREDDYEDWTGTGR
jgi:hypothetical protein